MAHDLERKPRTEDVVTKESRQKTFSDLLLSPAVLQGLNNSGFHQPSPVQLQAIPPAKIGFDCIVQSKSGTRKTCVYVVTALEMVRPEVSSLQVLVLAPTREIAVQGVTVAQQIGQQLEQVKVQAFIGGLSLAEDKIRARNCQIGVGTPGRIKQLISEGMLSVENVRLAVLDEADKMLESSFITDTTWILNSLPQSKQVMALSATYPDSLASLAERFMRSPTHVRPGQASQVLTGVRQFVLTVSHSPAQQRQNSIKQTALLSVLSSLPYTQCLVFSNYTSIAQATADFLNTRGFPAVFISAGQDQARRLAVMETFKQFNCRILCSTDLTARGIDAENVNLVVNMEVPWEHNTYLHRIGRGGRYGSHSVAVTLAAQGQELTRLRGLVSKTGSEVRVLEGEEIPANITKQVDNLQILAPADPEDEKKKTVETAEVKTDRDDVQGGSDCAPKPPGGKVKRRGKKKNKTSQLAESELNNSDLSQDPSEAKKIELEEDQKLIKSYLESKSSSQLGPIRSWEEISSIAERIETDQSLEGFLRGGQEAGADGETLEKFNKAVERVTAHRREMFEEKIEAVRKRTAQLSAKEMIKLLESGPDNPSQAQELEEEIEEAVVVAVEAEDAGESSDADSESSSSESDSDSNSDSSDSTDSTDSESSSESSEADEEPRPEPGDPNILRWYQNWYSGLAQQRQAIQSAEYFRYLQHYGYKY